MSNDVDIREDEYLSNATSILKHNDMGVTTALAWPIYTGFIHID